MKPITAIIVFLALAAPAPAQNAGQLRALDDIRATAKNMRESSESLKVTVKDMQVVLSWGKPALAILFGLLAILLMLLIRHQLRRKE